MKKSLIALAVMAAAGAASAQSSVQLYGIADVWFGSAKTSNDFGASFDGESVSKSNSTRQTKLDSGGVSTSRWGLKGSEDLGNGLKANFQLEQGFALDTGAADSGFNRVATVGVSSNNFGAVTLGKQFTAYDDIRGAAENTFDANISASKGVWTPYNENTNNTIKYVSPSFGGFSGALSYALGEDKNTDPVDQKNSASSVLGLSLQYANGPLFVGYGFQKEKEGTELAAVGPFNGLMGGWVDAFAPAGATAEDIAALKEENSISAVGPKATYNLLTASYNFGVAKLVGSYNQSKLSFEGDSIKAKEYQIGVEVPVAANLAIGAGYAQSKIDEDGFNTKNTGFSIAAVYSLSKRTALYAAAKQAKQKLEVDVDGAGASAASKTNIYAVGVKHAF